MEHGVGTFSLGIFASQKWAFEASGKASLNGVFFRALNARICSFSFSGIFLFIVSLSRKYHFRGILAISLKIGGIVKLAVKCEVSDTHRRVS